MSLNGCSFLLSIFLPPLSSLSLSLSLTSVCHSGSERGQEKRTVPINQSVRFIRFGPFGKVTACCMEGRKKQPTKTSQLSLVSLSYLDTRAAQNMVPQIFYEFLCLSFLQSSPVYTVHEICYILLTCILNKSITYLHTSQKYCQRKYNHFL